MKTTGPEAQTPEAQTPEAQTGEPPLRRVSRPAVALASASSAVVVGAWLAGFQFTLPSFLVAAAGCGVILGLGFTGGKVRQPMLEPLEREWEAGVQVAAPSARDLMAGPTAA